MWLNNCLYFGLRGGIEHRNLMWDDIILRTDENEKEFLEMNERQTKTRTGVDVRSTRVVRPRMYAVPGSERCPVELFKLYASKRPQDACDAFYLAVNELKTLKSERPSFKVSAMGQNKLVSLMKYMATEGGLSNPRLTNHSARKRLVQTLSNNNVPPTEIMQITGHKNVQSINNYAHLSNEKLRGISSILSTRQNNEITNISRKTVEEVGEYNCNTQRHTGLFANATINCNTFNLNTSTPTELKHTKRRRVIISSDSSQE